MRIYVKTDRLAEVQDLFNRNDVDFDYDSGDRFMIAEHQESEAVQLLEDACIDYELI